MLRLSTCSNRSFSDCLERLVSEISPIISQCVIVTIVGVAQGVITGIRGLCNGLGPALFGLIFFLFDVDLNDHPVPETAASGSISMMLAASNRTSRMSYQNTIWPSNRVCCHL